MMNLSKLFECQKILRDRIGYKEPDRFNKLILALLVELGECANEWRGFKFWSKNQEPHIRGYRMEGESYNPLLEEYVDGLHFVLELGIELDREYDGISKVTSKESTIEKQFIRVVNAVLCVDVSRMFYLELLEDFLALGEMLGFTWEEVEDAYYKKNQINHKRQTEGY